MAGVKQFAIETVFKIIDRMSGPMRSMGMVAGQFTRQLGVDWRNAQLSAKQFLGNIGPQFQQKMRMAATVGFMALAAGVGLATAEFIKFDTAITQAGAKFSDIKKSPELFTKSLQELRNTARQIGATTQFSAVEAGQGLDFLAMAGYTSKQAIAMLPGVLDLATVAGMDLGRATDIASDALGAFGLAAKDDAQIKANLARINDVFAKTITTSNTNLEMLFDSVRKGGTVFATAGVDVEMFATLTGTLANSGLKATEAGTGLRNMMLRLAKTTPEADRALKKLGVTVSKDGNFRNMIDIIADFQKGLQKLGTKERMKYLGQIFGVKTITSASVLINQNIDSLREYEKQIRASGGASQEMAGVIRGSLGNQLKVLQSTLLETGFQFLEGFEKPGRSGIETLTEAIRGFDPKPIAQGIMTAASAVSEFWKAIKPVAPTVLVLIGIWKLYKGVLFAAAVVQAIFNATLAANPIGLTIAAVFLLIAAITLLVIHWEKLNSLMDEWPKLGALILGVAQVVIGPFAQIVGIVRLFGHSWRKVVNSSLDDFERVTDFFDGIESYFDSLPTGMGVFEKWLFRIATAATKALNPLTGLWDAAKWLLSGEQDKRELMEKQRKFEAVQDKAAANWAEGGPQALKALMPLPGSPEAAAAEKMSSTLQETIHRGFLNISLDKGLEAQTDGLPPGVVLQPSGGA